MPSTAQEQFILELVNEARLDPLGNATRYISSYAKLGSSDPLIQLALDYFKVNGTLLAKQFAELEAVGPVAFSDKLASAARNHNSAMIATDSQQHDGIGDGTLATRVEAQKYAWSNLGENIYAYGSNPLEIHAAFMVDWGGPAANGGMQIQPGHRFNIMAGDFREVGIGVTVEKDDTTRVGELVVTEDFGTRREGPAVMVLGVAYRDADKDGFYSLGEGVAKLKVALDGRAAASGTSGGYTVETNAVGAKTVTLSGGGLKGTVKAELTLEAGENIKLDIVDGTTLRTSTSVAVSGPVAVIEGIGLAGLTLAGGAGAQKIIGTAGRDVLSGGAGSDTFVFDARLGKSNVDRITDFTVAQKDRVQLDHEVFSKLAEGRLAEAAFFTGVKAAEKGHRVIYNDATGVLSYDADGKGGREAVKFALLDAHLKLDHLDFLVV